MNRYKLAAAELIGNNAGKVIALNDKLAANPEIGFAEYQAVAWLSSTLKNGGFKITEGLAGLETAFQAEYNTGKAGPVIALLAEYDALPEVGHGCGHNMIAAISLAAAMALAESEYSCGKIVFLGCPAEENGGGKVLLAGQGIFEGIDLAMLVHPAGENRVYSTSLALDALEFVFKGRSAHASSSPEKGINALEAAVQFYNGVNAMRQYLTDDARLHGIIKEGGETPNLIPDRAVVRFYLRAAARGYLDYIVQRVKEIARGSALIVGAEVEWNNYELSNDNLRPNRRLAEVFRDNYQLLGVEPLAGEKNGQGSTDMGNVSQLIPVIHPYIAISRKEITGHTREFARATTSDEGHQALLTAARALAFTALDVMQDEALLQQIKEEHRQTFSKIS